MQTDFQFVPVPMTQFAELLSMDDESLSSRGARRMTVDAKPGFPCRVSLVDAEIGETVILAPFRHHDVDTPYRASGPVFVRQDAITAQPGANTVPAMLRHRLLSVRAYDQTGMMTDATVADGKNLEPVVRGLFEDPAIAYLHIHNAGAGCFNCAVRRAG